VASKPKGPCGKSNRPTGNGYVKDTLACPECGKQVRVINFRPKIGGRYQEHTK
jgi:hypothetical protein